MTVRDTIRKGVLVTVLATAASIGLGVTPAQAEPFHTSTMNKSWTPWSNPQAHSPGLWTIGAGTRMSMDCWTTGQFRDGTGKWFRVRSHAYPFTQGYVPANTVSNQWTTSPRC